MILMSLCIIRGFTVSYVAAGLVPQDSSPYHHRHVQVPMCCTPQNAFGELGIGGPLCTALDAMGVHQPNLLQQTVIPAVLGRESLIIGSQTGSGKTLTYLAPIMQSIKADEEVIGRAKPRRPRAVVLLPTRELALQIHGVAKMLSHHAKLSVEVVHGGVPEGPQRKKMSRPVDLLVATPGRLLKLMDAGAVYLGDVRYVALDEVDTMFDAGFGAELDAVLGITTRDLSADSRATAAGAAVQHLAVGATHPEGTLALYDKWLQGVRRLMISGSHTLPSTLRQHFLTCNGPTAKVEALRDILGFADEAGKPSIGRIVLFCNSQQSARFVDHTLAEEGYKTANYHGAIPANERNSNYESFLRGDSHVLVTTDLAARGLDGLDVSHVVQFDFAKSAADYVHRCGRTARAGGSGTVTSLVTKADMELVRTIREAERSGNDVVIAGEQQQRKQRARNAIELQVPSQQRRNGRPRQDIGAALNIDAFPDCRGISSHTNDATSAGMKPTPASGRRGNGRVSQKGRGNSRTATLREKRS